MMRFIIPLLLLFNACKQEKCVVLPSHVNAFPKKVFVYKVDTLTQQDSLIYAYQFFFSSSTLYPDRIGYTPLLDEFVYLDDSLSRTAGEDKDLYYSSGSAGNRTYFMVLGYRGNTLSHYAKMPFSCSDSFPADEYDFVYNATDASLQSYKRKVNLSGCGDQEDEAVFSYNGDTCFVGFSTEYLTSYDTILYRTDKQHLSSIPLLYHSRNAISQFYSGYYTSPFNISMLELVIFSEKTWPLIQQVNSSDFIADYSYLFNANGDVSELLIDAVRRESGAVLYRWKTKYVFEY